MISDIRLAANLRTHRKIKKLHKRLGADGVLSLIFLWIGAAGSKPDGVLSGWDPEDIALESGWPDDPEEFVKALLELRLLEKVENDTFILHNWRKHQAWVIGAEARSEKARNAAQARWQNQNECSEHASSMPQAMLNNKGSNAPLLSSPFPKDSGENSYSSDEEREVNSKIPNCPHEKIIQLFHEILPELSPVKLELWKGSESEKHLRARWRESGERQQLEWWSEFFEKVSQSDFLMGRIKDFQANLRWLVKRSNFSKVLEGTYHRENNSGAKPDCEACQYKLHGHCDGGKEQCSSFTPVN